MDIWTIGYSIYSEWGLDFNPKTWRYSKVYTTKLYEGQHKNGKRHGEGRLYPGFRTAEE